MDPMGTPLGRLSSICWRMGYVTDTDPTKLGIAAFPFRHEEDSLLISIAGYTYEAYAIGDSEEIVILRMVLPVHPVVRKVFMNIEEDLAERLSFEFFANAIDGSERTGFLPEPAVATTVDAADALVVRQKLLLPHADHVVMQRVMDAIQELLSRYKYLERELFRAFLAACGHLPDEGEDEEDESGGDGGDGSGFDGLNDFEPGWQHRLT